MAMYRFVSLNIEWTVFQSMTQIFQMTNCLSKSKSCKVIIACDIIKSIDPSNTRLLVQRRHAISSRTMLVNWNTTMPVVGSIKI